MTSRRTICRGLLAIAVMAALLGGVTDAAEAADDDEAAGDERFVVDDRGRLIRVGFPRYDRIPVDTVLTATPERGLTPGVRASIDHSFERHFDDDEIWWQFRHSWLGIGVSFGARGPVFGGPLFEGSYLRHDTESYAVVPGAEWRVPAPFDIAVEWKAIDAGVAPSSPEAISVEVVDVAVMLDVLRDASFRHRLAVGPVLHYGVERRDHGDVGQWHHSLVPVTAGRMLYRWERGDGRLAIGADIECGTQAQIAGVQAGIEWRPRCRASATGEWMVAAVNDRPISLVGKGAVGDISPDMGRDSSPGWSVTAGVRISLFGN